jgi:hypothetical protein
VQVKNNNKTAALLSKECWPRAGRIAHCNMCAFLVSVAAAVARRAESVCWRRLLAACAFLSHSFAAESSSIILAGIATILLNRILKPHLTFCLAKYIF